MAGDWIKTRVWLCRDPKVIRMADFLAEQKAFMKWLTDPVQQSCRDTAYEHVTRNVTVALCVTGLVVTWGTARERGNREGDDLVLDCCELQEVSAIADIPCFGDAMAHVGWAVERDDDCVVFPKFFKDQESPDDRHKRQNAERQAAFRERRKHNGSNAKVTGASNVTVTPREEKRRDITPIPPSGAFLRFWSTWPKHQRKQSQGKCWTLWRQKDFDQIAQAILEHVEALKRSDDWLKEGGAYIPAPLVYLRQRRWEGAEAAQERPKQVAMP
jgi:hypothetical protein